MEWLTRNFGMVAYGLGVLIAVVTAVAVIRGRVSRLEEKDGGRDGEQAKQDERIKELEERVRIHQSDTTLHIDPHRDEKRWDDFKGELFGKIDMLYQRFDATDRKMERLMVYTPPPGS